MTTTQHATRLDIRLSTQDKALMDAAARLRGTKLAAFVRAAALRESQAVLAAETPRLSPEQSRRFMAALDKPFRPNAKLARALMKANVSD